MSTITIRKVSITNLATDAIVNAANDGLWAGGGVCGAIYKAAGHDRLQAACSQIGHCDVGSAVITAGFDLKAKYIIHAVGPQYKDGKCHEEELLYSAYCKSLQLARENGCRSIGFPLISAGIFGYPVDDAWFVAIRACRDYLNKNTDYALDIVFAVLDTGILEKGKKILRQTAPMYKIVTKDDWQTLDMPDQYDSFILDRPMTDEQIYRLRRGNIPQEMEDKWFWYMEGDTLYAHRSWTGFCVYRVDFKDDGRHIVIVNRNPEQYKSTSVDEDVKMLNDLLNWWTGAPYDYYHEWLTEVVTSLKNQGVIKDHLTLGDRAVEAVYFHKPEEPNGYLSNWYLSPFELDGIKFSSSEQYIMYQKCMVFGDEESANMVLSTDDVAEQQQIGRNAKGYIGQVWAGMRQVVAVRGLMGKFSQNVELKEKLLQTGNAWLVECAHSDLVWACGIRLNDDKRFDVSNWRGTNILGFALMEVRSILQKSQ